MLLQLVMLLLLLLPIGKPGALSGEAPRDLGTSLLVKSTMCIIYLYLYLYLCIYLSLSLSLYIYMDRYIYTHICWSSARSDPGDAILVCWLSRSSLA